MTGTTNYGVDIAPGWVRIAYANVVLHDREGTTRLFTGDAFRICYNGELSNTSFDYIAMTPPFGITIDEETAKTTMGITTGRASEQLFTRLALKKLRQNGKAIIMVPNSLLTNNRRSEALKRDILNNHTLRAVISLGEGALYPFNRQDTALLLLEKTHAPTVQPWLFNVVSDGYPRTRSRDITRDPEVNDFSFILHVLHTITFRPTLGPEGFSNSPADATSSPISIARLLTQDISLTEDEHGYILKVDEQAVLQTIWLIEEYKQELSAVPRRYLFAKATYLPNYLVRYFVLPFAGQEPVPESMWETKANEWLEHLSPERNGIVIFDNKENVAGQTLAIMPDGRLLGCTRPVEHIVQAQYDLRPLEYLKALNPEVPLTREELKLPKVPEEEVKGLATSSAAQFQIAEKISESAFTSLSKVKQQQDMVRRHADYLLGQLEMRPYEELPPHIANNLATLDVLHYLDEAQRIIWQAVQQFADKAGHPYHFTRSMVYRLMEQQDAVKVQSTLDLLEQLGAIVRIHVDLDIPTPSVSTTRGVVYYRLVTEHDIVSPPDL